MHLSLDQALGRSLLSKGDVPLFDLSGGDEVIGYSLRDLKGTNPSVVRVRRDSDNSEQDFTASDLTDGTLEAFVGASNNGFVRTWYDQVGSSTNHHMQQPTMSYQPRIVNQGTYLGYLAMTDTFKGFQSAGSIASGTVNKTIYSVVANQDQVDLFNLFVLDTGFALYQSFESGNFISYGAGFINQQLSVGTGFNQFSSVFRSSSDATAYVEKNNTIKDIGTMATGTYATLNLGYGAYLGSTTNILLKEFVLVHDDTDATVTSIAQNQIDAFGI